MSCASLVCFSLIHHTVTLPNLQCMLGRGNADSRNSDFSGSSCFFLYAEGDAMKHCHVQQKLPMAAFRGCCVRRKSLVPLHRSHFVSSRTSEPQFLLKLWPVD